MPRVTAILVVQDGDRWLDRTLAALASQTRGPDALVVVAEPTTNFTPEDLERAGVTQVVTATGGTFGVGIARALRAAPPAEDAQEWLWLLRADSAPAPEALEALLAAVEVAPSVAVAGPTFRCYRIYFQVAFFIFGQGYIARSGSYKTYIVYRCILLGVAAIAHQVRLHRIYIPGA